MQRRQTGYVRAILLTAGIAFAVVLLLLLYPSYHPHGGMRLGSDGEDLHRTVRNILSDLQLSVDNYDLRYTYPGNPALLERTYSMHGLPDGNRLLRDRIPGYQTKLQLNKRDDTVIRIQFGSEADEQDIERIMHGDISMHLDMHRKLLQFWMPVSDSLKLPSLTSSEAYVIAHRFMLKHAAPLLIGPAAGVSSIPDSSAGAYVWNGILCSSTKMPERTDHTFSWTAYDADLQDSIDVSITVSGERVADIGHTYRALVDSRAGDATGLVEIFEILFFAILVILMAIVGFRRLRSYEIGFRSGIVIGIMGALLFSVWMTMELSRNMDGMLEIIAIVLVSALFIGVGLLLLWAVSESVGREVWKDKFISYDLLASGHFLHSRLGSAVLTGVAAGFLLLLTALAMNTVASSLDIPVWILERGQDEHDFLSTEAPAVFLIAGQLLSNIAGMAFFLVFFVSLLRMRIRNTALLVAIAVLPLTVIDLPNLVPVPAAYIVLLPVMLLLVVLFIRTDIITTLIAMVTLGILHHGLLLALPWNSGFFGEALVLGILLASAVAYGIASMATADRALDFNQIAPRFQQHITERQRLARELEIARDVQMSFLPKHEPVMPGLDIASHCVPALEVGGDYYDFMPLGDGKLGIAIGDVSGKGTQAAFYMTLTKGFLKALGSISTSPAEVLRRMNTLFYDNVERGHFISMIYAVFDMERRVLTVARAGHPHVLHRGTDAVVNIIRSRGMALGFDEGGVFSESIEELSLPLNTDDVFVFYTDGYPEAMTRKREEFGEERMSSALAEYEGSNARDILTHMHGEIRRFTGRAKQHDDMTMVVVRVE